VRLAGVAAVALALAACSSSTSPTGSSSTPSDAGTVTDSGRRIPGAGKDAGRRGADGASGDAGIAAPSTDGGPVFFDGGSTNVRGQRYCEILGATLSGTALSVQVYSTWGLSACPETQWAAEDTAALKTQLGVTVVELNGPRYWVMDTLVGTLISTAQVSLGGIDMRQAGAITGTYSASTSLGTPYVTHQITRNTVVTFLAGKTVYELVDPTGKIYDMQSYSVQKVTTQTEATLANLGATLSLPAGWSWRTRVLTADLVLDTPGSIGIVVQDDNANTYQQSQQ